MKALSIQEPWLLMIVDGKKTIETRTWCAPIALELLPLLLVGSKKPKGRFSGKAACIVRVVDCQPMRKSDEDAACCEVYPKAMSWMLSDIQKVWPVPIKGQLGIYDVPSELIRLMSENDPEIPTQAQIDEAVGVVGQYELDLG